MRHTKKQEVMVMTMLRLFINKMKIKHIIFFWFTIQNVNAQVTNFNFGDLKIQITLIKVNDTLIKERIVAENLSKSKIYLPIISDTGLYFFSIGNSISSYFGGINNKYGPAIGMKRLYELQISGVYYKEIFIKVDKNFILTEYFFSIDYVLDKDLINIKDNERDKDGYLLMNHKDYLRNAKTLLSSYINMSIE